MPFSNKRRVSNKCRGNYTGAWHYTPRRIVYTKPVKRFQMKSNGCRDVQHTGLQSTQTIARKNTGKQGAQTRALGTSSKHPLHCMSNNQAIAILFKFCNLEIDYNYDAATDVGMLGKMRRVPLFVHLAYQCSCLCAVCWTSLYIHLISFEIFLLASLCTF